MTLQVQVIIKMISDDDILYNIVCGDVYLYNYVFPVFCVSGECAQYGAANAEYLTLLARSTYGGFVGPPLTSLSLASPLTSP